MIVRKFSVSENKTIVEKVQHWNVMVSSTLEPLNGLCLSFLMDRRQRQNCPTKGCGEDLGQYSNILSPIRGLLT